MGSGGEGDDEPAWLRRGLRSSTVQREHRWPEVARSGQEGARIDELEGLSLWPGDREGIAGNRLPPYSPHRILPGGTGASSVCREWEAV